MKTINKWSLYMHFFVKLYCKRNKTRTSFPGNKCTRAPHHKLSIYVSNTVSFYLFDWISHKRKSYFLSKPLSSMTSIQLYWVICLWISVWHCPHKGICGKISDKASYTDGKCCQALSVLKHVCRANCEVMLHYNILIMFT